MPEKIRVPNQPQSQPEKCIDLGQYSEATVTIILEFLDFVEEVQDLGMAYNQEIALPAPSDLNGVFRNTLSFLNTLRGLEIISDDVYQKLFEKHQSFQRQLVY